MANLPSNANIALGEVSWAFPVFKFGRNDAVAPSVFETIWDDSSLYTYFSAGTASIVSTSALDDDPSGTGARTIQVVGLDVNFDPLVETVALNGLTPVVTTGVFLRIYRMRVLSAGSGSANAGVITATVSAETAAVIQVGANRTQMAIFTIPAGFTALLYQVFISTVSSQEIDIQFAIREQGGVFEAVDTPIITDQYVPIRHIALARIPEMSDLELRGSAASGNARVTGGFELQLVDNNAITVADVPYWQRFGL